MKKITTMILTGVFCLALAFSTGCTGGTIYPTYEDGFFVYYKKGDYVEVVGLTELGHQQKVIVMPETIGGHKYGILDSRGFGEVSARWGKNNTLEKICFPKQVEWLSHKRIPTFQTFADFSALKKIIYNSPAVKNTTITLSSGSFMLFSFFGNYDKDIFRDNYEEMNDTENNGVFFHLSITNPANIEFMYNYEEAPNEGYYWIDDIDNGEKIEIIPPDPEREGYIFCGWYCEPECVNKWDFDTIINIPVPIETSNNDLLYYPKNYVTFIYAKWNKK